MNPNTLVKIFIVIFVITITSLSYKVYEQVVFVQTQRKQIITNFYDENLDNNTYQEILEAKHTARQAKMRQIMGMKSIIKRINLSQKIYNTKKLEQFGDPTCIIVIQVHSNAYLLRQLLDSMSAAYSISSAFLIFSHDVYNDDINNIVHSVKFAKYMQIFYPYSIQLHPNVFPGVDRSCPDGPDCRDPVAAQLKHHWWWQANQVFDYVEVTRNYSLPILFLEEDNYVTVDFLIITKMLQSSRAWHYPVCDMISLGAHDPYLSLYNNNITITMQVWNETMSNIGIGFNRAVWQSIKNRRHEFCYFNDYTWDNTLKHMGSKHKNTYFYVTTIDGPRVFRVEKCDDTYTPCRQKYKIDELKKFVGLISSFMFPLNLRMVTLKSRNLTVSPLGYFSDERDHELCMHLSKGSIWY